MKLNYLSTAVLFFFLLVTTSSLKADEIFKKEISKNFTTTATTLVDIQNKFGDVKIENHDANQVLIKVVISVEADDQGDADDFFKKITINFSESTDLVKAVTEMSGNLNGEFSIDYVVTLPKNYSLNIKNKFGGIVVGEHTGKVNFDVSYGSLQINALMCEDTRPRSEITLAYSDNCHIGNATWLKLNASYSDISIQNCKALILVSKYSEFNFGNIEALVSEAKYDEYTIAKVGKIVVNAAYTDFKIAEVTTKLEFVITYGDLQIDFMPATFQAFDIDAKYTDIRATVAQSLSYKLDIQGQYTDISVPNNNFSREEEVTKEHVYGTTGSNPSAIINMIVQYGDVELSTK